MDNKSSHILNASSNLLGFCLIIITSLRITKTSHGTYIDESAGIASICLAASCFFSFLSLRSGNIKSQKKSEKIAEYLFITALVMITVAVILLSIKVI